MRTNVKKLVIAALMAALGVLLPMLFHMLGAGTVLLPMHIPVLLCGLLCGVPWGAACGLIVPFLSSAITGMPPLFPVAVSMSLELCAYGAMTGLFYRSFKWNLYVSLLAAMLVGRVVSGIANAVLFGITGAPYGFEAFLTASFVTALPGIAIQIVFIPVLVIAIEKLKLVEPIVRQTKGSSHSKED